jgi:hypothetical protein
MNKFTQKRLQREAERLIRAGKMPSLEEVCAGCWKHERSTRTRVDGHVGRPVKRYLTTPALPLADVRRWTCPGQRRAGCNMQRCGSLCDHRGGRKRQPDVQVMPMTRIVMRRWTQRIAGIWT